MEKYCVYYDSAVDDIEYEPRSEGSWYRVEDVEPILNSIQQLQAKIAAVVSDMECCQPSLYPVYWSEYVNKLRQLLAVQ